MINKLLVGTALAIVPAAAMAADLPVRTAAPAPVFVAAAPTWAGFYIGANAGIVWSQTQVDTYFSEGGTGPNYGSGTSFGGLVGVTAGYNFQSGNFVYGLEGDIGGVFGLENVRGLYGARASADMQALGTIRVRAGIASGATLFYLTAGAAAVDTEFKVTWRGDSYASSSWKWAPVVGAGIEHQLGGGWSAKVEALYIPGLDRSVSDRSSSTDCCFKTWKASTDVAVVRFGVNYRFGAAARSAPVVARY